ncbi:MAG: polyphosphate kinase 1 [Salinivirgaceae bacterium]|jgi:polyphosphate kinase|nr:polyphosphate kinase 1 [Salinivirgaceae bacterium]
MEMRDKYFDREISWLSFNERVLQEASDTKNPLTERIKFLGIFSNNQDEFFKVRVATINRLIELKEEKSEEGKDYHETFKAIISTVKDQQKKFSNIYNQLKIELNQENIFIVNEKELDDEQGEFVRAHFRKKVRHNLFPLMLRSYKSSQYLADRSIYLAIMIGRSDAPEKDAYAIMEVPTASVNRFLILPEKDGKKFIIILDDVIRYCLDEIFARFKYDTFKAYTFKFTRDAELDIDNDVSKSFLEVMSESLLQRKSGTALRFVYDREMPEELLNGLTAKLRITDKDHLDEGGRYHNFKDFMRFPNLGGPELENEIATPVPHKNIPEGYRIMRAIRKKDIMLHYPYQSFHYIVELLREASIDAKVKSIKMTLYRVSNPSNIINALISAARNGKQVTVFLELQARFDEEANIYWSGKLQEAGVNVLTGIPGLKVHSKLILITRKEGTSNRMYANVGTGNFHEKTGDLYCDDALLTADPRITSEVEKVFGLFKMSFRPSRFRTLIVSPFSTRNFFLRLINNEIRNANLGREAWMTIKLNSLSDIRLINKLYQASQTGVKINLIIRGICKLIPGVKGVSENIRVISILDKYLEHSRIMVFCNGGDERYFISSADWMVRNLDNRIEVTTPIFDPDIQQEIKEILEIQLMDNTKTRIIDKKMGNEYFVDGHKSVRAQIDIHRYLYKRHIKLLD